MKQLLKYTSYGFAALLSLVAIIYGVIHVRTNAQMNRIYHIDPAAIKIPTEASAVEWGEHIAKTRGCTKCHGQNLGGRIEMDDWAVGRVAATNLTSGRGGVQKQRSKMDWIRAIRHGIGVDGRPLLLMPSGKQLNTEHMPWRELGQMTDTELRAIWTYLQTLQENQNHSQLTLRKEQIR
ncbi:c-type cytochrome [candidate division KSB1 bacterium]|nr:c-type cytochrome [candidate division KSB1 bacterium]